MRDGLPGVQPLVDDVAAPLVAAKRIRPGMAVAQRVMSAAMEQGLRGWRAAVQHV